MVLRQKTRESGSPPGPTDAPDQGGHGGEEQRSTTPHARDDSPARASARGLALADELLAAEEGPVEVGADHPVPLLERDLRERFAAAAHAGAVDQDVGRPEGLL